MKVLNSKSDFIVGCGKKTNPKNMHYLRISKLYRLIDIKFLPCWQLRIEFYNQLVPTIEKRFGGWFFRGLGLQIEVDKTYIP